MDDISVSVIDMNVAYRNFSVSGIAFSLKSGDIFGLVGRSGSGKSSVLRNLIGIESQGRHNVSVSVNGHPAEFKRIMGYAPQDNSLYDFLTIEENLHTFGKLHAMGMKEIKLSAEKLLRRLDLYRHRTKRISEISGGMQKRADLAAALISNPGIIVLDEPFNGLDISLQKFFWEYLEELAENGKVIIISSHILSDIQKYCNQIGLVQDGKFYFTKAINDALKSSRTKSLQEYLEKLFEMDLLEEND